MFKNTVKTFTLLASLGGFLVLCGSLVGGPTGMLIGLGLGLVVVGSSYWLSDTMAVRSARAEPADSPQLAWLRADLDTLAARAGMQHTPRLFLSPDPQPNAFATARNERRAVVCVTAGLLAHLDRDEVRGVVAHEVAHIRHRDILIGSVAAAVATGISAIANMAMFAAMFGGSSEDDDRPSPATLLLLSLVAPIAATVMQMALSRSREYEADRLGAELAGDPRPLASALRKIELLAQRTPMDVSPAQATAYIVNPLTGRQVSFAKLFLTHPPTSERIERLGRMATLTPSS
ncbi:MAG: M48 family metalloprotease [Acidimicrobiia bacterium]|nr:M48 family metalloprotease [Acidimicrobiia bacterium]